MMMMMMVLLQLAAAFFLVVVVVFVVESSFAFQLQTSFHHYNHNSINNVNNNIIAQKQEQYSNYCGNRNHHHHHYFNRRRRRQYYGLQQGTRRRTTADYSFSSYTSRLFSSSRSTTSQTNNKNTRRRNSSSNNNNQKVVYQKVIRCNDNNNNIPDVLFLGYLVEYLQEKFVLPDRLSMPYEKTVVNNIVQKIDNDTDKTDRSVVQIDSNLSPSSQHTCLYLEVVGIFSGNENDSDTNNDNNIPNMAMVVVRKEGSGGSDTSTTSDAIMPPMLQNLFADCEKRIIHALDIGLDDFTAGKIPFDNTNAASKAAEVMTTATVEQNRRERNDFQKQSGAILAEIIDDDDENDNKDTAAAVTAADLTTTKDDTNNNSSIGSISKKKEGTPVKDNIDYAVAAAMKKAAAASAPRLNKENRKEEEAIDEADEDYAVRAAQKVAAARRSIRNININVINEEGGGITTSRSDINNDNGEVVKKVKEADIQQQSNNNIVDGTKIDMSSTRPPILDPRNAPPRAFMKTISKPGDYKNKKKTTTTSARRKNNESQRSANDANQDSPVSSSSTNEVVSKKKQKKEPTIKKDGQQVNAATTTKMKDPKPADNVDDKALEEEIMKQTQQALTDLASGTPDMTPEELLENVMKFGEEKERKESVGGAFVSGAFEKAKDLLREQKQMREERLRQQVVDKVSADFKDVKIPEVKEELSPDEEIRKMFEAGERIADGRIAVATSTDVAKTTAEDALSEKDKDTVDSLIAGDKTISSHARILDEELAELEVRINKSPEEKGDGPSKNNMFDILSGPEVYNPNVDPETAVNWPGALPGTRDVKLPMELSEAVKQAGFAAEVLSKLEVKDGSPAQEEDGVVTSKRYFVGDRELSQEQVDNLRTVLQESIEIGLIDDPLQIMSERSRFQMLLDELRDQPEERIREVASNYKDLLLSDHFASLVKERLSKMADEDLDALRREDESLEEPHARERDLLGTLVGYAQLLLKEARALGAELEAQQLEVVRSICKVAMDPSHATEEDAAMALTDAVRDMRPLFDDTFVAYLKYAVAEEEGRLARAGLLDDPEQNQWLFVLKIVQQGVYTELARGINRYIDHIWYVLRMETPVERRMLLKKLIDVMPTLDVRPFVQVVENIAGSLGDSVKGEFDGITPLGEMTNKILQLRRDVQELLPSDRIALMSRDADEWAEKQKKRLMEQRKLTKQRLEASRQTEHLDGQIEAFGRRGEIERIE